MVVFNANCVADHAEADREDLRKSRRGRSFINGFAARQRFALVPGVRGATVTARSLTLALVLPRCLLPATMESASDGARSAAVLLCLPHDCGTDVKIFTHLPAIASLGSDILQRLPLSARAALATTCRPLNALLCRGLSSEYKAAVRTLHTKLSTPEAALHDLEELEWPIRQLSIIELALLSNQLTRPSTAPLNLRSLVFPRNDLSSANGRSVVRSIPYTHLQKLDLSSCKLGVLGAKALAAALHASGGAAKAALKELYLSNNAMGDGGAAAILRCLVGGGGAKGAEDSEDDEEERAQKVAYTHEVGGRVVTWVAEEEEDNSGASQQQQWTHEYGAAGPPPPQPPQQGTASRSFDDQPRTRGKVQQAKPASRGGPTLHKLDLGGNSLTDGTLNELCAYGRVWSELRLLSLSSNQLGGNGQGMVTLAGAMGELLPSLECLFVDHNCLCEADGMALADALRTTAGSDGGGPQQLASLREIDLRWQQQSIGAAAMDAIMRARPTDRLRVSV